MTNTATWSRRSMLHPRFPSRASRMRSPTQQALVRPDSAGTAVVIGGGIAGTLAALALCGVANRIFVVERDQYPSHPDARPGVPQAHHAHLLLEAGHQVLEDLAPGIRNDLEAAGAVSVALGGDLRWISSAGVMAKHSGYLAFLSCTRPVLDWVVRERVREEPSVEFIEHSDVVGLLGTPDTLTGVRIRDRGNPDSMRDLHAEMIVDASGRSSAMTSWLAELGCAPVLEETVDPGVAYTSRLYHRPPDLDMGYTAIYVQTKPPDQPRTGSLLPVEHNRWIVSLGGMRGAEPGKGERGFEEMLAQLHDPTLREILRTATPASAPRGFRPGPSRWRHYERNAPDGLVVLGDAACAVNPVYAQGMPVAVLGAHKLRSAARQHGGIGHDTARAARHGVAAVASSAWLMSSSEDRRWPTTHGGPSGALVGMQHQFLDRVLRRATADPAVAEAFQSVMSLTAPPTALLRPRILSRVMLGGLRQ